ncbi:serine/threonine-protein kinase [Actinocorallia longicatena]|uniref:non-specific serine/threonine protein kinase n=1 Tax=Actinocorallia longicatena TaxID=111803 RepID=A0ABP6QCJ2_9ACTN
MVAQIGRLVAGQYRLIEKIGRGGFGVVWRAHDERLDREVAVKELYLPAYLAEGQRKERRTRSLREARSAARIDHRGAVTVYDVVEEDDCPFIVMEYLKGRSLEDIIKEDGPLPVEQVAEIGLQLLEVLRAAHASGVVHRDVKPSNVIITAKRAVLTDFGIATIEGDTSITQSGFVMGAPAYCSPERAKGDRAEAPSDLWSLGATLYYAVEGHQPFPGTNANQVFHAILTAPHRPCHRAGLLGPLLDGLLIKEIGQRLTASDTALLLAGATQSGTPREQVTLPSRPRRAAKLRRARRSRYFAPIVTLAVLSAGALFWTGRDTPPDTVRARAEQPVPALPEAAGKLLTGASSVRSLAVSPDGATLAVGTDGKSVQLWDPHAQHRLAVLKGPQYATFGLAFSPDGKHLAASGYDAPAFLWNLPDLDASKLMLALDQKNSLAFSPDSAKLTIAGNSLLSEWSVRTHKRTTTPAKTEGGPFAIAISRQGDVARVGVEGVYLERRRLAESPGVLPVVRFSPDGRWLAVGGDTGKIMLWKDGVRQKTLSGTGKTIQAIAFSPDGTMLACADGDTVKLWNSEGMAVLPGTVKASATVTAVAFWADDRLAVATESERVELWKIP